MQRMGGTARQLVESSRGALDRALSAISQHLAQHQGGAAQ